ncbi:MAG: diacylglycerol kinase family protein [Bacteroidia bacterium]|nr:diacylglycerol kinase family protein [Bacteroidia bacterium]
MTDTESGWYIIINPHAGSGKTMAQWSIAERRLAESDILYTAAFTGYKSHAKQLAYEAAAAGYRKIMAVGGDGSVHEIFTGAMGWCEKNGVSADEFYFGVIPIGSGNDWIKSFSIPHDTVKVVDIIKRGKFMKQDVVSVSSAVDNICYMANIGGVGFDSHVCERVNAKKERGRRSERIYVNSLIYTVLHLKRIQVEIIGDGESIFKGNCFSIAFGNGRYSGGGMLQTGLSEIDDGLIDVMIVPAVSLFKILKEVRRIFNGTTHESDAMIYRRCRHLKVVPLNAGSADIVEVDGEIEGRLPMEIKVTGMMANVLTGEL